MGIVNVTPDSFSDGGLHATVDAAVAFGEQMWAEGAQVLDVGGESSRPGAVAISAAEELARVVPVVRELARRVSVPISVDTTKSSVALAALDVGAVWINDISAGRSDPLMAPLAAARKCPIILMHSRATPSTMQQQPYYSNVVTEVKQELLERVDYFLQQGVARANILLDVGFGFAKRFDDNIALLRNLDLFCALGFPLLCGTSRKSFIGTMLGTAAPDKRLFGSLATVAAAISRGASVVRVHDVKATVEFVNVLKIIEL